MDSVLSNHSFDIYSSVVIEDDVLLLIGQGNYVAMSEEQMKKVPATELETKVKAARQKLFEAGAHFVVDTVTELPAVIDEINRRLEMGLSP